MSDLQSMHSQATKLIMSLREGVERLESTDVQYCSPALVRDLQRRLDDLRRLSTSMDSTWRMHVVKEANSRRDIWKRKVEQVSEEYDALRSALDKYSNKFHKKVVEEQHRNELMSRSAAADLAGSIRREMDMEAQAHRSVFRSKQVLEEAFSTGQAVLENMGATRERLKTAQRKLFDVLNTLGLSESVMRLAERRQHLDKILVYGGMMFISFLLLGSMWWAVSRKHARAAARGRTQGGFQAAQAVQQGTRGYGRTPLSMM